MGSLASRATTRTWGQVVSGERSLGTGVVDEPRMRQGWACWDTALGHRGSIQWGPPERKASQNCSPTSDRRRGHHPSGVLMFPHFRAGHEHSTRPSLPATSEEPWGRQGEQRWCTPETRLCQREGITSHRNRPLQPQVKSERLRG